MPFLTYDWSEIGVGYFTQAKPTEKEKSYEYAHEGQDAPRALQQLGPERNRGENYEEYSEGTKARGSLYFTGGKRSTDSSASCEHE